MPREWVLAHPTFQIRVTRQFVRRRKTWPGLPALLADAKRKPCSLRSRRTPGPLLHRGWPARSYCSCFGGPVLLESGRGGDGTSRGKNSSHHTAVFIRNQTSKSERNSSKIYQSCFGGPALLEGGERNEQVTHKYYELLHVSCSYERVRFS